MKRFLNIESCNFVDYPTGGQTTFAKQVMQAYGNEVALVGITTDKNIPIGEWTKVKIGEITFDYFAVIRVSKTFHKPLIPKRLQMYMAFRKYKKEIFDFGIHNVFVQAPEILFAIDDLPWDSICVNMPGIVNPLENSRYQGMNYFAGIFDYFYIKSLKKASKILASADNRTIENFLSTRGRTFAKEEIIHFPTRVETNIFFPKNKYDCRNNLSISKSKFPIFVVTGRLAKIKGWKLIIDSFIKFHESEKNAMLYFVGDGEDRQIIKSYIVERKFSDSIILVGAVKREEVVLWINAADAILVGSFVEGWSLSMLESAACGKPIVSTDISGAQDIIIEGLTGFISYDRDVNTYAKLMLNTLKSDPLAVREHALNNIEKYALCYLKNELDKLWKR